MTEVEKITLLRVMVGQPNEGEWSDEVLTSYLNICALIGTANSVFAMRGFSFCTPLVE